MFAPPATPRIEDLKSALIYICAKLEMGLTLAEVGEHCDALVAEGVKSTRETRCAVAHVQNAIELVQASPVGRIEVPAQREPEPASQPVVGLYS